MSAFLLATDELVARATTGGTEQDFRQAVSRVNRGIAGASAVDRDEALRRLGATLPGMHPLPAAGVAMTCGAIVENGGDSLISGPALLGLLPDMLAHASRFHERIAEKAHADGLLPVAEGEDPPEPDELNEKYFDVILADDPEAAYVSIAEEHLTLAAIAHLSRSKPLRAAARGMPELLQSSVGRDGIDGGPRSFLTKMLLVLDDEPLLVLHTDQRKGYRATFGAIADNFHLHTILMGHLIGNPKAGWIKGAGSGSDRAAIRRAMTGICDQTAPVLTGAFNLWNWTGLQADGTLPEATTQSDHWIWNEGVPEDIVPFEGLRVVVLGPPPYERMWRGGSAFGGLAPEFSVAQKLPEGEVVAWLRKLGAAPKPSDSEGAAD